MESYVVMELEKERHKLYDEFRSIEIRLCVITKEQIEERKRAIENPDNGLVYILNACRDYLKASDQLEHSKCINRAEVHLADFFGSKQVSVADIIGHGYDDREITIRFICRESNLEWELVIANPESSYWINDKSVIYATYNDYLKVFSLTATLSYIKRSSEYETHSVQFKDLFLDKDFQEVVIKTNKEDIENGTCED